MREGWHLRWSVMHSDHAFLHVPECTTVSIKPEVCCALAGWLCLMGLHAKRLSIIELIMRHTREKRAQLSSPSHPQWIDWALKLRNRTLETTGRTTGLATGLHENSRYIKFQWAPIRPGYLVLIKPACVCISRERKEVWFCSCNSDLSAERGRELTRSRRVY